MIPGQLYAQASIQERPELSLVDRTRLAEAFRLAAHVGDRLWPGWSQSPFAVLLVTNDYEFLIRHPQPSPDFANLGFDRKLKSDIHYRKRTLPRNFLATFPAIRGSAVSTIVVGQAENTSARTSTPWVITLLHEHFHQLQESQPNYYAEVNALNLSRGDQTGMWMLNYAFPYGQREAQEQFASMSKLLSAAVQAPRDQRLRRARDYLLARQKFQSLISPDDDKYFAFQLWKEGIARYTEYHAGRLAAVNYVPSSEFRALKDFRSFRAVTKAIHEGIFRDLLSQQLGESKREVVYAFGAAEGLLLDALSSSWRRQYFQEKFDLRAQFPPRLNASLTRLPGRGR